MELVEIKAQPGEKTFKVGDRKEFKTIKEAVEYGKYFYGVYYFLEVWVDGKMKYTSPKYHKTFYPANSFKGSYRSTKWRKGGKVNERLEGWKQMDL